MWIQMQIYTVYSVPPDSLHNPSMIGTDLPQYYIDGVAVAMVIYSTNEWSWTPSRIALKWKKLF